MLLLATCLPPLCLSPPLARCCLSAPSPPPRWIIQLQRNSFQSKSNYSIYIPHRVTNFACYGINYELIQHYQRFMTTLRIHIIITMNCFALISVRRKEGSGGDYNGQLQRVQLNCHLHTATEIITTGEYVQLYSFSTWLENSIWWPPTS